MTNVNVVVLSKNDRYSKLFVDSLRSKTIDVAHSVIWYDDHTQLEPRPFRETEHIDIVFVFRYGRLIPKKTLDLLHEDDCIVVGFHTSPLPEYRGGSPLQHQIIDGKITSEVCSFEMDDGCDTGSVYMRSPITLAGSIDDIWRCIVRLAVDQAQEIIRGKRATCPAGEGPPPMKRRTDNVIPTTGTSVEQVHRFIQMLDGVGYQSAYLDVGDYRIEFTRSSMSGEEGAVKADAVFRRRA